ncbi:5'-methylthioadenosine/S-adenosylhomocysteine nucleosidase [termite gut metagenome]|uniref:5'-methylthioadenosine/S-adenosylhomocysteine nucleosidase n=1 Tax=termite gut metagenome TaxID=433724 RepID=A0A5J4RIU5_9ZZZZ
MIKILIIDDTEDKIFRIKSVIVNNCNIPESNIDVAKSINSGRKLLCDNDYDLLLLDLVLPLQDNEEPDREESPKFIDEIHTNERINLPNQIIGLTQYDESYSELKKRFEDKMWYLVKYEQSKNDWITMLQNKIIHLRKNKESLLKSILDESKHNIGIICALPEEFIQFKKAFNKIEWEKVNNTECLFDLYSGKINTGYGNSLKIIAGCVGRPGVSATSVFAATLYNIFKVDHLFMTGFCAGFESDDIALGDIIVADSIQDYSAGKIKDDETGNLKLLKELQQIPANYELTTKINTFISDGNNIAKINTALRNVNLINERNNVKALLGPTICGPFVVTSETLIKELKDGSRKLKSLDMEGFGLYLTSHFLNKKCLWIKSIADFANSNKGDEYHNMCSYASASFLYNFIKESF